MKEFLHKTHVTDQTSSFQGRSTSRHTPVRKMVSQSMTTSPVVQRKPQCSCDGGCPTCAGNIQTKRLQAKLTVGQPNDRYEQEADRVADQVMRMPEPAIQRAPGCSSCPDNEEEDLVQTKPIGNQITPLVQRQEEEDTEEEEEIQQKPASNKSPPVTPAVSSHIHSLKGSGHPLPSSTRTFFEPRFGKSFRNVRLHTGSKAAEAAGAVNAQAFTFGNNIVFGAGRYSPGTTTGRQLLAHELTHTIQQGTVTSTATHNNKSPSGTLIQRRVIHSGRILDHGNCQHLACNSRWACTDTANGIMCPAGTRNAGIKKRPLFTCDVNCSNNRSCSDTDNYMALPRNRFRMRKCNQDLVICGNNRFTHAYVRDRSHLQAWEVSPTVLANLGVTGTLRHGRIYPDENDPDFKTDGRCR